MAHKVLFLLIPALIIGYVYAQNFYPVTDPYVEMSKKVISDAYKVSKDIETRTKNAEKANAEFIETNMLGTWHLPGGDTKIEKEDLDIINRIIENHYKENMRYDISYAFGVSPPSVWQATPLDVCVYALIKYYWTYGFMIPPNEIESGMPKILGFDSSNSKATNTAKAFLATYKVGHFNTEGQYKTIMPPFLPAISVRTMIRPPFLPAINLKSILLGQTELTSSNKAEIEADFNNYYTNQVLRRTKSIADYMEINAKNEELWRNVMDDWKEHDAKIQQHEEDSRVKREAYQEEWEAEGIASDTEMLLWKIDREF